MRHPVAYAREPRSRREFLRLGGAGLAATALLGASASCGGQGSRGNGAVELTFNTIPDPTGTVQKLVDRFNRRNEGEIRVTWRITSPNVSDWLNQLTTEYQSGSSDVDVVGGDVIWPAQFAANGWIVDLSDRLTEKTRDLFLDGALASNIYDGRVWGVPWGISVGMFYYRSDLLERAGFSEPPATWEELKEMSQKVQSGSGTEFGFMFQGAAYEGGVVDGLEYIWTHGGDVLDPDDSSKVVIDSPEAAAGLATERSMIASGVAPEAVVNYTEEESQALFFRGDAVFMRNWPDLYALAADPSQSEVRPEQIGVSALPVSSEEYQSTSSSGGFNMYINAASDAQAEAWEFVEFMTAAEQQKTRVLGAQQLPTLKSLYEDDEVRKRVPVVALGEEAIRNARPRPVSPYYQDMSLEMAEQFNACLKGDQSPEETTRSLQGSLQEIIEQTA